MFFYLKKFIAFFFEPLTITFIILGIGIYYLCKKEPNLKRARKFIIGGTVFLFLMSSGWFSHIFAVPLESKYPAVKDPDPKINYEYVHVLGSGHSGNENHPPTTRLGKQGMSRVIEGIRLHRLYPGSKIIFSGYGGSRKESFAKMASLAAMSLGVKAEDIILIEDARDTIDESKSSYEIIGEKPFFLVSSASHLTRSTGLFTKLGMNPTPAPTDFISSSWEFSFPKAGGLKKSERGIYEALGITWAWLTGRL